MAAVICTAPFSFFGAVEEVCAAVFGDCTADCSASPLFSSFCAAEASACAVMLPPSALAASSVCISVSVAGAASCGCFCTAAKVLLFPPASAFDSRKDSAFAKSFAIASACEMFGGYRVRSYSASSAVGITAVSEAKSTVSPFSVTSRFSVRLTSPFALFSMYFPVSVYFFFEATAFAAVMPDGSPRDFTACAACTSESEGRTSLMCREVTAAFAISFFIQPAAVPFVPLSPK